MNQEQFVRRKADHIRFSLSPGSEAVAHRTLDRYRLIHDSLPDLDFEQIRLESPFLGSPQKTPFFVAGMTAGHPDARVINERLAAAAARRGWGFGLGSQRRELEDAFVDAPIVAIRKAHPDLRILSNLGIAQLIAIFRENHWNQLTGLLERSGTDALAIHLNPLQEAVQAEGTRDFRGGRDAIRALLDSVRIPVVLKETGSGMSAAFLARIADLPIHAVDVSGLGGTHWGRIEGMRAEEGSRSRGLGETFADWGVPTARSIENARAQLRGTPIRIWASGGLRSGLDAAKCIALGAHSAGFARPALEAAIAGDSALDRWMERVENELRTAMFCTGSSQVTDLTPDKIGIGEGS
jgi:isopentenyl-diphosphate delta-isomerase